MTAFSLALLIIPIGLSFWICHTVAKKKGLNKRHWQLMAVIFGPLAVPFVFLAKSKMNQTDTEEHH